MKKSEFHQPGFIPDSYKMSEFKHVPGEVVVARVLDNLPPNILESMPDDFVEEPDGYVIKEYLDTEEANKVAYWPETDLEAHQKVDKLKKRRQMLIDYFADVLPDLVLKSDFFIGSQDLDSEKSGGEKVNDEDEKKIFRIYEIQKRLSGFINPESNQMFEGTREFLELKRYLENLSSAQKVVLSKEIDLFCVRFRQLFSETKHPIYTDHFPDLHEHNVALTADGHLRVYDTNALRGKWAAPAVASVNWMLNQLEFIKKMLDYD